MELKHRKNLINFYIEIKIKTGLNIANDLEKLTKDRFKHWDFEHIEQFIYRYYVGYLNTTKQDAINKLNELKNDY